MFSMNNLPIYDKYVTNFKNKRKTLISEKIFYDYNCKI